MDENRITSLLIYLRHPSPRMLNLTTQQILFTRDKVQCQLIVLEVLSFWVSISFNYSRVLAH